MSAHVYTYEDDGNLTREESDSDLDGQPDSWITYTYDPQGRLLVEKHESVEENGEIENWLTMTYTYAEGGELLTELIEDPGVDLGFGHTCMWWGPTITAP